MCRQAAWSFAPAATTPGTARLAVREELAPIVVGPAGEALIQDTTLMVSELLTNAVAAGCRSIDLQLTVHHNHLVIDAWDDASGHPRLAAPGPSQLRGRGLLLIDTLARRWTVKDRPIGKTVHVEVAIPPGSIGALPCDASIT